MKKMLCILLSVLMLAGCTAAPAQTTAPAETTAPVQTADPLTAEEFEAKWAESGHTRIFLNDGATAVSGTEGAVTVGNDIVYYEAGHDFTYGEGEESEAHTPEEAAAHTVVTITQPGTYVLTGSLSKGQVAVDLGKDADEDPNAVVTLILDGVNITCEVAPGVIFYNVYECGDKDDPKAIVDTSAAGANVILEGGSINNVVGSHVAKIYKPESVVLSEDGKEVEDAKKLHKYDAAFYSRMSMNIGGEGTLNINADNEGLDSELHLTINSGTISIASGNDGINTNEDGVSVTTINGGCLRIHVTGTTGEGDGIDSNGWLVINGGTVESYACPFSGDAGIDSDMGILINGGTVCATGNMLDRIADGGQTHIVFTFAQRQEAGVYTLKNEQENTVLEFAASNGFQYLILSSPALAEGVYTLWSGKTQFQGMAGMRGGMGFGGGQIIERPDWPDKGDGDVEIPPQPTQPVVPQGEGQQPPEGAPEMPEGGERPEGMPQMPEMPESGQMPQRPEDGEHPQDGFGGGRHPGDLQEAIGELTAEFRISQGANCFTQVQALR